MPNQTFVDILRHLQSTGFRDLAGAGVSATIPVSERLINEVVATSVRPGGPVREVTVHPLSDDGFSVKIAPRAALLPSITLRLDIEAQPDLPSSPMLVLRMATMGGLLGLAGSAFPIARMLPPGVHLEADRIIVDLRTIAAQHGVADLLAHLTHLRVNTDEGRVVLHLDLSVK